MWIIFPTQTGQSKLSHKALTFIHFDEPKPERGSQQPHSCSGANWSLRAQNTQLRPAVGWVIRFLVSTPAELLSVGTALSEPAPPIPA